MFKWYRNATVGCVHLAQSVKLEKIYEDEWLRRGWTLQELLAPTAIKFYDSNWQPLYGERGDRAFCRLVEAIMLASGDSSVLNWGGGAADLHNSNAMPHSPIAYLCGFPHDDYLRSTEGLDMAMTSRGLQVQLLILPMKPGKHTRVTGSGATSYDLVLSCCQPQLHKNIGHVAAELMPTIDPSEMEWALGVFNYIPANELGQPALRHKSGSYLLCKKKPAVDQSRMLGSEGQVVTVQTARLTDYSWNNMSTTRPIHLTLKGVSSEKEAMVVDKSRLEVVYL